MRSMLPLAILLAVIGTPPASAQGTPQQRENCEADAYKFCSSKIPFVSQIEECLQSNISRLSRACRREFAAAPSR
jgi:hypothetical protein